MAMAAGRTCFNPSPMAMRAHAPPGSTGFRPRNFWKFLFMFTPWRRMGTRNDDASEERELVRSRSPALWKGADLDGVRCDDRPGAGGDRPVYRQRHIDLDRAA